MIANFEKKPDEIKNTNFRFIAIVRQDARSWICCVLCTCGVRGLRWFSSWFRLRDMFAFYWLLQIVDVDFDLCLTINALIRASSLRLLDFVSKMKRQFTSKRLNSESFRKNNVHAESGPLRKQDSFGWEITRTRKYSVLNDLQFKRLPPQSIQNGKLWRRKRNTFFRMWNSGF